MRIDVMKKGDEVINVTNEFVAIRRKGGEVDIIPLLNTATGLRVDLEGIITIGYGDGVVTVENENGTRIINF